VRIIDSKFRLHVARYILQSLLATVAIMVVLVIMDVVEHTALIASLGASAFIAFTMPETHVSGARCLVGGYLVGVAVGVAFALLYGWLRLPKGYVSREAALIVLGALAVGLAIFLMVITDTEHPPAAGVALGLVLHEKWDLLTLAVILSAIVALWLVKWLLRRSLKNLI